MIPWIVVAAIGGVVSLGGLAVLLRQYRLGHITRRYMLAVVIGYASLVSYSLLDALQPRPLSSVLTVLVLLPGFFAIIVVVRERQRALKTSPTRNNCARNL